MVRFSEIFPEKLKKKLHTKETLRWLYYSLLSLKIDEFLEDSAVPGLNREYAYSRALSVPPLEEQRIIAKFLDHETAKIDNIITTIQEVINNLKEYREALIFATVSGKIDVREEGAV